MATPGFPANVLPFELDTPSAPGWALCLTGTGSFTWCLATDEVKGSGQFLALLGLERAIAVTFTQILARVHPDDRPSVCAQFDRAHSEGGDIAVEFRHLIPGQEPIRHLRLAARAVSDSPCRGNYVGVVQDVTSQRLCEAALREARAELAYVARVMSLGALAASIAHEIKQPLSGIITNASTCLRMLAAEPL